jgi:hypothetical protein
LAVPQTSDQINLTKASNGQTLANLVLFEPALWNVLDAIESCLFGENSFADGNLVVEDNVLIHGLEADNLSSFQEGIGVMHVEQVIVNFFVENVWQVLVLYSRRHLYF